MNTETTDNYTATSPSAVLNGANSDGTVRKVAQKAHNAVDSIEQVVGKSAEHVVSWQQEYGNLAREQVRANPLAIVVGAFAIGYLFAKI
ncbi:hypothetical protein [Caenimonas koreensis]|uniref:DUF883 domain-containing protein n=1 Tax=Caenimonas koreensis DSM 17982 TaxID=1121255 RepID=A0A844B7L8_9BURK|nr:hypothetical protein [Caenimonas koreensis]MRD46531.1 hypothetical protein [Caenimonas koreensis DSM 17982]